jgi:hypothetical protein
MRRGGAPKASTPEEIAASLTVQERVALFCAATGIDHAAAGITPKATQGLAVRDLIERDYTGTTYTLTDRGRDALAALLVRAGLKVTPG